MIRTALLILTCSAIVACGSTSNQVEEKKLSQRKVAKLLEKYAASYPQLGIQCRHFSPTGTNIKQTYCTTKEQRNKMREDAERELLRARTLQDNNSY